MAGATDVMVEAVRTPASNGFSAETLMFEAAWHDPGAAHREHLVAKVAPTGFQIFPEPRFAEQFRLLEVADRNFYDRYYFNRHRGTDELMLLIGLGQYPNLGVTDAFALARHGRTHRVVRASRELGADRMDTSVGPFRVEVIEGLKKLRVVLEAALRPDAGAGDIRLGPSRSDRALDRARPQRI